VKRTFGIRVPTNVKFRLNLLKLHVLYSGKTRSILGTLQYRVVQKVRHEVFVIMFSVISICT